jgi:hypothetical protein
MLTRPAQMHTASPAERLQLATLFGMLGTFLGIVGVALVLWLFQIQGRLQEQGEAMDTLARSVERLGDNQRLANDTLVRKIAGDKPEEFVAQYNRTLKERDEAVRGVEDWRANSKVLSARARELDEELQSTQKKLDEAKVDAKEAPELRKQVANLRELNDRNKRQLEELEPFLKKSKEGGIDVDLLMSDLSRTRYFAYAGWGIGALLAAGLAATFFLYKPTVPDADAAEPQPPDGDRPTHRIV